MKHTDSRARARRLREIQRGSAAMAMYQVYLDARLRQGKRGRLLARLRERLEVRRRDQI